MNHQLSRRKFLCLSRRKHELRLISVSKTSTFVCIVVEFILYAISHCFEVHSPLLHFNNTRLPCMGRTYNYSKSFKIVIENYEFALKVDFYQNKKFTGSLNTYTYFNEILRSSYVLIKNNYLVCPSTYPFIYPCLSFLPFSFFLLMGKWKTNKSVIVKYPGKLKNKKISKLCKFLSVWIYHFPQLFKKKVTEMFDSLHV